MGTPEDRLISFGARVRELRTRRSLSQEALAQLVGIHRTYVSGVEQGRRNVGLLNVFRLADALQVEVGDLFVDYD